MEQKLRFMLVLGLLAILKKYWADYVHLFRGRFFHVLGVKELHITIYLVSCRIRK